jgi:uncharacterized membrane protein YfcA
MKGVPVPDVLAVNMSFSDLSVLLLIVMLASYMQALTGFAFGLVLLSLTTLTGVLPIADASQVINVLALLGTGGLLLRGELSPDRRLLAWGAGSALVMVPLGFFLLHHMSQGANALLRSVLGIAVICSSLSILLPVRSAKKQVSSAALLLTCCLSGLMGGMFSAAGPPLVYLFYRLGLPQARMRDTLMLIFASNSIIRLLTAGVSGEFNAGLWLPILAGLPVYFLVSRWGIHHPPPLPAIAVRRLAALLMLGSGGLMLL